MNRGVSIVKVDLRPYRLIAQEAWGLTDKQMEGMHVHHRIPKSKGGTNDPSNLFVCSPSFHRYAWHGSDSYSPLIEWAVKGGRKGGETTKRKSLQYKEKGQKYPPAVKRAKASHSRHKGTQEYSERQSKKAVSAATSKRSHWTEDEYDFVWHMYLASHTTGYRIAKKLRISNWKRFEHMLNLVANGFSYEQIMNSALYSAERDRLKSSTISHILDRYDD